MLIWQLSEYNQKHFFKWRQLKLNVPSILKWKKQNNFLGQPNNLNMSIRKEKKKKNNIYVYIYIYMYTFQLFKLNYKEINVQLIKLLKATLKAATLIDQVALNQLTNCVL